MTIENLLADLINARDRNAALKFLTNIVVEKDERLLRCLANIIREPETIDDTNSFATLLTEFRGESFISPLVEIITRSEPGQSPWLADYMYALGTLLEEGDDYWVPEEHFVRLLGKWLFSTNGGEISWKSANIMSELRHPATKEYFFKGAVDRELFSLTRIACIRGIVNHYRDIAEQFLKEVENDPEQDVKDSVLDALKWLNK